MRLSISIKVICVGFPSLINSKEILFSSAHLARLTEIDSGTLSIRSLFCQATILRFNTLKTLCDSRFRSFLIASASRLKPSTRLNVLKRMQHCRLSYLNPMINKSEHELEQPVAQGISLVNGVFPGVAYPAMTSTIQDFVQLS